MQVVARILLLSNRRTKWAVSEILFQLMPQRVDPAPPRISFLLLSKQQAAFSVSGYRWQRVCEAMEDAQNFITWRSTDTLANRAIQCRAQGKFSRVLQVPAHSIEDISVPYSGLRVGESE